MDAVTVIKTRKDVPRLLIQKTSLASLECLAMPLVHQVVLTADFQCPKCQERINDVISRMNEIESVVLNVLDKTVTITCKYRLLKDLRKGKLAVFMKICRLSKKLIS
ncbi:hypothetical protein QQ045_020652 [Rhodiola kirilowii]